MSSEHNPASSEHEPPATEAGVEPTGLSAAVSPEAIGGGPVRYQPSLEEIFEYLDGHIDADQQAKVQAQLQSSGCCDELFNFQVGVKRLLGSRCRSELPADLPQRVFGSILDDLP
jgi:hypothetical protein